MITATTDATRSLQAATSGPEETEPGVKPNLPTNIVGFRGFDSSIILILRGGIPRPIGIS